MTNVFVLNAGSSSVKYQVLDPATGEKLAAGLVERIGVPGSGVHDHASALARIVAEIGATPVDAVGHRVVHGGQRYVQATVIDDEVERGIEELTTLAPLHNPPGLQGIRAARAAFPGIPHVAVFDTAFHAHMPPAASTYAIDAEVASEHGIRRYGFHGTSYRIVAERAATLLGRPLPELRLVILHLGNGASAAAVAGGRSVDTTMGLTPLEGLVMGTRSGDIDPAVLLHLARTGGYDIDALDVLLNKRSGLLGLSGRSDMRELVAAVEAGDAAAQLAFDVYIHRIHRYVGAYAAELGGLDALVFTAGVGENSAPVRAAAVAPLGFLGLHVDPDANATRAAHARSISPEDDSIPVLVVPTDEELQIARETAALIAPGPSR